MSMSWAVGWHVVNYQKKRLNGIWVVSVHKKGVVIVLADDGVEKLTCEVDVADR